MKRQLFILTFCTLLVIGLGFYWRTKELTDQVFYDFCFDNEPVVNEKMLENTLSGFEIVAVQHLPKIHLNTSKMQISPYREMVASCKFYKLKKKDVSEKSRATSASKTSFLKMPPTGIAGIFRARWDEY